MKASDKGLYRAFAHLATDWIWELDDKLCYVFHDGWKVSVTGKPASELSGLNRIDALSESFPPSEALEEHHQCMRQHRKIDLVLPYTNNGNDAYVHIIAEPQFNQQGEFTGYRGCGRDVTSRVLLEAKIAHLATHDDLTGVMNRREFERQLGELLQGVKESGEHYSLCFIDLDRFKAVNDTGGHHAGDQLLRELVGLMRKHLQAGEHVARLGGDEFGLILCSEVNAAAKVAESIIDEISRYNFNWNDKTFRVGASIGIAEISSRDLSIDSLMIKADNACYAAKNNGRNQSHISDDDTAIHVTGGDRIDVIKRAIENNQYKLLMQPIVSNAKSELFSRYELLVRLACDDGNLLEPAEFMPLAKKYSLLQELDYWVIENALVALEDVHAAGEDLAISINLSASTLANTEALSRISSIFKQHKIPKARVCIDITETYAIRNLEAVSSFMHSLRAVGVEFALDDFGKGLSSFTYLQHLPIDYLKIDGELIRKLSTDETARCITRSFHELSHRLGIKTVAESVEDDVTCQCVKDIGIDYMQGFGVGPLTEVDAIKTLKSTALY